MRVIHDLSAFSAPWEGSAVTLGVFDGMHIGHRALMKRLEKRSRPGLARVLLTYSPHPDIVLGKSDGKSRQEIFTYEEKLGLLQDFDLDAVIFLPFSRELARMSAEHYLKEVLINKLRAKRIIIGYDQTFGQGRKGDFTFLRSHADTLGYTVDRVTEIRHRGRIVSSSLIRELLAGGDVEGANELLGHDFFLTGTVVRGHRRGRTIGYPTANLDFSETKAIPGEGVYAGVVTSGGDTRRAMINIGKNPTFGQDYVTVEAHLLDFDADLYGEQLRVHFLHRIRDEIKFSGLKELKARLDEDAAETRRLVRLPGEGNWASRILNRIR